MPDIAVELGFPEPTSASEDYSTVQRGGSIEHAAAFDQNETRGNLTGRGLSVRTGIGICSHDNSRGGEQENITKEETFPVPGCMSYTARSTLHI
jgi:hypothetical protein